MSTLAPTVFDEPADGASPFHTGEQNVQERLGVRDIETWARQVVRNHLPHQHRAFHTSLPFLVASARDHTGRPWITLLEEKDGFLRSPDPYHLTIQARPLKGDALEHAFKAGADVGLLGIELATRRRNRVNGQVLSNAASEIQFRVGQSFGNCPQYIRERSWRRASIEAPGTAVRGPILTQSHKNWIEAADTFFIGTGYRGDGESAAFGMDASHRGGERGFVQVVDETRLRFPDYAGNNHFNTVGNLTLDPRAGFLFVDFETGSLLQLTGTATIDWDSEELKAIPGARRLITLNIEEVVELPSVIGLRWDNEADSVRSLRLVEKIPESVDVTSFIFEARDAGPLPQYEPGQHLPIELTIPGLSDSGRRTYSLSSAPDDQRYRITVKREHKGLASKFLHDQVEVGAIIESRRPAGEFLISCAQCPLVLISAGVGMTPMVSMLHAVAKEDSSRPVWFIHGARDGLHHPLANEVQSLADEHANISVHVAYSQPGPNDKIGIHYDSQGRIDGSLLTEISFGEDAHYFLCGLVPFMTSIKQLLVHQDVSQDRIHYESFGASN